MKEDKMNIDFFGNLAKETPFLPCAFFIVIVAYRVSSKSVEPHGVRTGIVPIFDGRITNEPITFTYTTAPPPTNFVQSSAYPVQFKSPRILPTLSPINYKDSLVQTNYKTFNEKWQYSPAPIVPLNEIRTTPIYNQAQYYNGAGRSTVYSISDDKLKLTLQRNMVTYQRQLAERTSLKMVPFVNTSPVLKQDSSVGAMEPFMADLAEQMGRVVNTFIKQQNSRMKKFQHPVINPLRFFRSERSSKTDEEAGTMVTAVQQTPPLLIPSCMVLESSDILRVILVPT
ncbi:unnamed protein product [Haemonchus placei]|uniref:DUF148 domain-containing protein n=1 Tax=Haemonchus placei TaxID=6290 RepID=A0A0N4X289_HAEPC|nr:unnamed protein product [Haemonchus placei]